jgi:hypothetical protein
MSPVSFSTTALAYSLGVVLVKASMVVMSSIACCAARRVHSVMGMAVFALLLVCCCVFGVARCACREPHIFVLWE